MYVIVYIFNLIIPKINWIFQKRSSDLPQEFTLLFIFIYIQFNYSQNKLNYPESIVWFTLKINVIVYINASIYASMQLYANVVDPAE